MSKIDQIKIPVNIEIPKYELVRLDDGLVNRGYMVDFIEWGEDGKFKEKYSEPQVGFSCILDGNRMSYTWCTTTITEIIAKEEKFIKFRTENSSYELHILD